MFVVYWLFDTCCWLVDVRCSLFVICCVKCVVCCVLVVRLIDCCLLIVVCWFVVVRWLSDAVWCLLIIVCCVLLVYFRLFVCVCCLSFGVRCLFRNGRYFVFGFVVLFLVVGRSFVVVVRC